MARIAGVDLPRNKQARIALTYIYGIGQPRALKILGSANVDMTKKIQDLSEDEVNRIRQVIEAEGNVEGDLRKDISMHIKRLIEIGSYRGYRHRRNLPVRGQRTHTNARTRKGPRKGTVANKKKTAAKT
jgi:small subunit ribosomal protein S13